MSHFSFIFQENKIFTFLVAFAIFSALCWLNQPVFYVAVKFDVLYQVRPVNWSYFAYLFEMPGKHRPPKFLGLVLFLHLASQHTNSQYLIIIPEFLRLSHMF